MALSVISGAAEAASAPAMELSLWDARVFEENKGQYASTLRFVSRGRRDEVQCGLHGCAWYRGGDEVKLQWLGSRATRQPRGENKLQRMHRYYRGRNLFVAPVFAGLRYRQVYPGVDFVVRGDGPRVEYDWHLAAGVSPSSIKFRLRGADHVAIQAQGDLLVTKGATQWVHQAPKSYQKSASGEIQALNSRFIAYGEDTWGFAVDGYDKNRPLVIDPGVTLGGSISGTENLDFEGVAVNSAGTFYYFTGTSLYLADAKKLIYKRDAVVAKVDASTGAVVGALTYFGGAGDDVGHGIAIDPATGAVFVTGSTQSEDFPIVSGTTQPQSLLSRNRVTQIADAPDAFVAKFDANLAMLNSTFLGGENADAGRAVIIKSPYIYVVGSTSSSDFTLVNPVSFTAGGKSAFVVKIDDTTTTAWSTAFASLYGGSGDDYGIGLDVNVGGDIFLTGHSNSDDLAVDNVLGTASYKTFTDGSCTRGTPGGSDAQTYRCHDVYLTKWTQSTLNHYAIAFATYLGGAADDLVARVRVESTSGAIYVTGATQSSPVEVANGTKTAAAGTNAAYFPTFHALTNATVAPRSATDLDVFVAAFASNGQSLVFSTLMGGQGDDAADGMVLWPNGGAVNVILAGHTLSPNFPLRNPAQSFLRNGDGFLARLVYTSALPTPLSLATSTFLGGTGTDYFYDIALADGTGNKWVLAGGTGSRDAPVTSGSLQKDLNGLAVVWNESNATFVDRGVSVTADAGQIQLGNSVRYQLTLVPGNASGDNPYLWVSFPDQSPAFSTSLTGCRAQGRLYSCPLTSGASPVAASFTATPAFSGTYTVRFGIGGLYSDNDASNLANSATVSTTVTPRAKRSAADPLGLAVLVMFALLMRWSRRHVRGVV